MPLNSNVDVCYDGDKSGATLDKQDMNQINDKICILRLSPNTPLHQGAKSNVSSKTYAETQINNDPSQRPGVGM